MKNLFVVFFLIIGYQKSLFAQKDKIPSNIEEAIQLLSVDVPDELKLKIKNTSDDSLLQLVEPFGGDYFALFSWAVKDSALGNYYKELKVYGSEKIQDVVLRAFKRYLNGEPINHEQIVLPIRLAQEKWEEEYKVRFTLDSLKGIYIPKDLDDCFRRLNELLRDSTKQLIKSYKEDKFVNEAHLTTGMQLRNNWKLWVGSRLTLYFNNLGIYHAEDMSGIILRSYHRYLLGRDLMLETQIKRYKYYWTISKKPEVENFPSNSGDLDFYKTFFYKSKRYGEGALHIADSDTLKGLWLFDYHLGWAKIPNEELLSGLKGKNFERLLKKLYKKYRIEINKK